MMTEPIYTGRLTRTQDGAISGFLVDAWGWKINFTATKDAEGYALTGRLGEVPDAQRLPAIDGIKSD